MRYFIGVLTLLFATMTLNAGELNRAYKKEYTFLKAQKEELIYRLKKEKIHQNKTITSAKETVNTLRNKFLSLVESVKMQQKTLEKMTEHLSDKKDNSAIMGNVIMQAKEALFDYGVEVNDNNKNLQVETLKKIFSDASVLYKKLSSIRKENGKFYLANGSKVEGEIVKVGNISAYGISTNVSGALAPAGNGAYKVWNSMDASSDAKAFYDKKMLPTLNMFVYENMEKEVEYKKEKTIEDTIKAGGVIGYIILGLGLFGLLLLVFRVIFLTKSGSDVDKITDIVIEKLKNSKPEEALEAVKEFNGSTARVIKATLRNINRGREHIEDIVMENILNESSQIDRFGNFVLVIAAVAPLLGLLGTVTGMIATFDIITEHGTGDPKLLSGGISEALVTTMLGLVVAIPLLLLGNLLSGWAQNIKDSMEQHALHIVNIFEIHKVK